VTFSELASASLLDPYNFIDDLVAEFGHHFAREGDFHVDDPQQEKAISLEFV